MAEMISYFPLEEARKGQIAVVNAIDKAFKDGYRNVIVDAPVGSGKSAVAVTIGRYSKGSHILTPRKSLQDQYFDDFNKFPMAVMKGRGAYPCTFKSSEHPNYRKVIRLIQQGSCPPPKPGEDSCAQGPCLTSAEIKDQCNTEDHPCPYIEAIGVASQSQMVVHNLHSFIFQAYFANRFDKRDFLVVDEAHEIEGIVRGFSQRKVTIPKALDDEEMPDENSMDLLEEWADWLTRFANLFSDRVSQGSSESSDRIKYLTNLTTLEDLSPKFGENFIASVEVDRQYNRTRFIFTPERVGDLVNQYLLQFGEKRLFMSGTIYSKSAFCRNIGLNESETCYIRIGSTFPVNMRPIYYKKEYLVDTSHTNWDKNFGQLISNIEKVMDVFDDVKGLIHTPSYAASIEIFHALKDTGRMVIHSKDDLAEQLKQFYEREDNSVFLSPVCGQGVDFKYDRARFQCILRVPYENTSDAFNRHKVQEDYQWYNYQALVKFGQQIGRVNRAPDDFGVTVLMDERFGKFLRRNQNVLPKWVMDSIIYK